MISAIIYIAANSFGVDLPWYAFILPVILDLVIISRIDRK